MSLRGGFQAGLWLVIILCFCFSVSVSRPARDDAQPVRDDDGHWNVELRLACQPSAGPEPGVHRPRPPEAVEVARAHEAELAAR